MTMSSLQPATATPKLGATRMTRRAFLTITAAAGGLLAARPLTRRTAAGATTTLRETRMLMGTVVHLGVVTQDPAAGRMALRATFDAMERLIQVFDHRRPDSALARLNRAGVLANPPSEFVDLLRQAETFSELSGGAFDVTIQPLVLARQHGMSDVTSLRALADHRRLRIAQNAISLDIPGMAVTLDGLAKGRVIDEAVTTLRRHGCEQVLVEAGGDLAGLGARADGAAWRVGVTHPRRQDGGLLAVLDMPEGGLATSGDYMNYFSQDFQDHHIIDPRTGHSPDGLASVTVLAPTATTADALSTALMVLGVEQGLALVAQLPNVEALFVTKTLDQIQTAGFPLLSSV